MRATSAGRSGNRVVAAGLALLALAVAGYAWRSGLWGGAFSPDRVPALGPKPTTLVPGLHLLGGLSPSAAYAVETSRGLVLVDSGLKADAGPLKAQLKALGLDPGKVRAVLLTHAHGDHTGGAEALRREFGARVYAGKGDAPVLEAGGPKEAFFSTFFMPDEAPHPTTIDVPLSGGESIDFGDVVFRAIATPGHTPGSVCYLLERGPLRAFFGGDVVMMLKGDDPPRIELDKPLGTYSAYLSPKYRGDAATFLTSLRALRALPVPDLVLPGHPGADRTPQSPCLSRARWESLFDAGIRDLETLLARYKTDGADFLDGEPKALLPDLYYLGDFRGAAVYGFFASSAFYLIDAPGGPGLADFVDGRLRALGVKPAPPSAVLLTSAGPEATAGLAEILGKYRSKVVASPAAVNALKAACPPETEFVPADELGGKGWFAVSYRPVGGRGLGPAAYQLTWGGKIVLASGRIPVKVDQQSGTTLFADFLNDRGDVRGYLESVARLGTPKPDLWLPAVPAGGQNANLYDGQWEQVLAENWLAIQQNVRSLGPRAR